jgi:hypothetical protein
MDACAAANSRAGSTHIGRHPCSVFLKHDVLGAAEVDSVDLFTRPMRNAGTLDSLIITHWSVIMFGKSAFFGLVLVASLATPVTSFAQDAGVSGIPRGPGNAGGLNNSVNDPSGIGNAARIAPLPQPNITVPVVPSAAPLTSTRVSPVATRRVRINTKAVTVSRRETRRSSSRAAVRERNRMIDSKFSICRGC